MFFIQMVNSSQLVNQINQENWSTYLNIIASSIESLNDVKLTSKNRNVNDTIYENRIMCKTTVTRIAKGLKAIRMSDLHEKSEGKDLPQAFLDAIHALYNVMVPTADKPINGSPNLITGSITSLTNNEVVSLDHFNENYSKFFDIACNTFLIKDICKTNGTQAITDDNVNIYMDLITIAIDTFQESIDSIIRSHTASSLAAIDNLKRMLKAMSIWLNQIKTFLLTKGMMSDIVLFEMKQLLNVVILCDHQSNPITNFTEYSRSFVNFNSTIHKVYADASITKMEFSKLEVRSDQIIWRNWYFDSHLMKNFIKVFHDFFGNLTKNPYSNPFIGYCKDKLKVLHEKLESFVDRLDSKCCLCHKTFSVLHTIFNKILLPEVYEPSFITRTIEHLSNKNYERIFHEFESLLKEIEQMDTVVLDQTHPTWDQN